MKLNTKNTFTINTLIILSIVFVNIFSSCSDDDSDKEPENPYLELGIRTNDNIDKMLPEDYSLTLGSGVSESYYYFMYTNIEKWTISAKGATDVSWVKFWPSEGKKDGRFYLKTDENQTLEERKADVIVTASNGKEITLFTVSQAAPARTLWLSPKSKTVTYEKRLLTFSVNTNALGWDIVSYDEGITIISVDKETGKVVFEVSANNAIGATERKLKIFINTTDTPVLEQIYTLTQKYPNQP